MEASVIFSLISVSFLSFITFRCCLLWNTIGDFIDSPILYHDLNSLRTWRCSLVQFGDKDISSYVGEQYTLLYIFPLQISSLKLPMNIVNVAHSFCPHIPAYSTYPKPSSSLLYLPNSLLHLFYLTIPILYISYPTLSSTYAIPQFIQHTQLIFLSFFIHLLSYQTNLTCLSLSILLHLLQTKASSPTSPFLLPARFLPTFLTPPSPPPTRPSHA